MANGVLIHDSADKTPPPPPGRHPLSPISGADFPTPARRRAPAQVWILLSAVVAAVLAWLLYRLDEALRDLFWRLPWLGDGLLLFGLAVAVLGAVGALLTLGTRAWLSVQHARVLRSRHGVPIDVVQQMRLSPYVLEQQALDLEALRAPYLQHPNLSTLSNSATVKPAEPPMLAAPFLDLVQAGDWVRWLNEDTPHVLLAGPSGSGKSTTARALLSGRVARGDRLCVIDPHGRPGAWPVDAYGAGRDYAQIADVFELLLAELDARYKAYRDGRDAFERLTIVVDEIPAIAAQLGPAWTRFFRATGSEARKVRMHVLLISQSALIKDIGSSTSMRENYARLGFGTAADDVLRDERDADRRRQVSALIADRPHVAALEWRGRVHALDLADVPRLASERLGPAEAWQADPCSVPFREAPDTLLSGLLDGTRNAEQASERDARAIALFRAGYTFRDVAEQIRNAGYTIANAELLELRRQALNDAAA
jgi:hypothetical protein